MIYQSDQSLADPVPAGSYLFMDSSCMFDSEHLTKSVLTPEPIMKVVVYGLPCIKIDLDHLKQLYPILEYNPMEEITVLSTSDSKPNSKDNTFFMETDTLLIIDEKIRDYVDGLENEVNKEYYTKMRLEVPAQLTFNSQFGALALGNLLIKMK